MPRMPRRARSRRPRAHIPRERCGKPVSDRGLGKNAVARGNGNLRLSEIFDPEGLQSEGRHESHFLSLARYGVAPVPMC